MILLNMASNSCEYTHKISYDINDESMLTILLFVHMQGSKTEPNGKTLYKHSNWPTDESVKFLDKLSNYLLSRKTLHHGVIISTIIMDPDTAHYIPPLLYVSLMVLK
jgi:hypothetical protein